MTRSTDRITRTAPLRDPSAAPNRTARSVRKDAAVRAVGLALVAAMVAITLGLAACESVTGPGEPEEITELPRSLTAAEREVAETTAGFGLELLGELIREDADAAAVPDVRENNFISPLSASMALGMTLNGADGQTFEEMRETLGFDRLSQEEINESYRDLIALLRDLDPRVELQLANAVWLAERFPFRQAFRDAVEAYFRAQVTGVEFQDPATADRINAWVEKSTEGRIVDFVEPGGIRDLAALLANAVYFNGQWSDRFDPDDTSPGDFRRPDGSTVRVPFMSRELRVPATSDEDLAAVDLPYGGKAFSMTVILPRDDLGLRDLIDELDGERWRELVDRLERESRVRVEIPKFELEYEALFNDALKAMGMETAFDPRRADFGRLVEGAGPGDFFIEWVKQKSFVSVDEEGTEAAAATGVGIGVTSSGRSVFRVDRPFLFAIRERHSGIVLFLGAVVDPSAG